MEYKVQQRKNGCWESIKGVRVKGDKGAFNAAMEARAKDPTWGSEGWRWTPAR